MRIWEKFKIKSSWLINYLYAQFYQNLQDRTIAFGAAKFSAGITLNENLLHEDLDEDLGDFFTELK